MLPFPHSQDGEDLPSVKVCAVELGDEDGSDTLEDGGPIHVDSGTDGQNEAADTLVHAIVLLHTLYHGGQGRRAEEKEREAG